MYRNILLSAVVLFLSAGNPLQAQSPGHDIHGTSEANPTADDAQPKYPRLGIIGFTDVNFFATDQKGVVNSGFSEGQFILHFTSLLSPRFSFIAETSMTALAAGATSADSFSFRPEVERAILKYDFSDAVKLSFGRYHTPVNYWNTAYHHGQWLQTTISRPEMTRFGGDFIPVHFVGGLAEGSVPAGGWNLNYNLAVGNGRSTIISRGGDAGDVNNSRAWVLGLFSKPDRFYGLQVGGAFYNDKLTLRTTTVDETIAAVHVVWTRETPEVIAEYAQIRHDDASGETENSAYYVQLAYRLPLFAERLKPYARYERTEIDAADVVFTGRLRDREVTTIGLRCELASIVAAKIEYRKQQTANDPEVDGAFAQLSFTF